MNCDAIDWHKRFCASPFVWTTWYMYDGIEELGNVYDSKEAAELEVEWSKRNRKRCVPVLRKLHIHSIELSKERWSPYVIKPM